VTEIENNRQKALDEAAIRARAESGYTNSYIPFADACADLRTALSLLDVARHERDEARAKLTKESELCVYANKICDSWTNRAHVAERDRDALRAALEAISGMSNDEIMREVAQTALAAVQANVVVTSADNVSKGEAV
jgi:hypothetical protein